MICRTATLPNPLKPMFTAITLAVLALAPHAPAQELARRLILKDGSYQLVTKYEVKGDRVRYHSAERDEWEELPTALVDWPATDKYEKERAAAAIPEAAAVDKEIDAERAVEESQPSAVAPGLRLPEESGVFLLDNFQGQPQLVEVQQTEGDVNRDTKANIFRGAINPAGVNQTIELDGEHASIQAHVEVPSIYINVEDDPNDAPSGKLHRPICPSRLDAPRPSTPGQEPQQPQQPEQPIVPFDRFRIVRPRQKRQAHRRQLKRNVTGKISQDQHFVKTTIDRVSGGWLKLTPTETCPGEYALIEMKGNEGMNLYVWDFGVNPNAPANANPWKPDAKPPSREKKLSD